MVKRRTISNAVNGLWIGVMAVGVIKVATTDVGQTGRTVRGLLLGGLGGGVLLLILGYRFRNTIFSRKAITDWTAQETAQFTVCLVLAFACFAVIAAAVLLATLK